MNKTIFENIFESFDVIIKSKEEMLKEDSDYFDSNVAEYYIISRQLITINLGRRMCHTYYINSRFNPETDIVICRDSYPRSNYENISNSKMFTIRTITNKFRGKDYINLRRIWIDDFSVIKGNDSIFLKELYKIICVFTHDVLIIGLG